MYILVRNRKMNKNEDYYTLKYNENLKLSPDSNSCQQYIAYMSIVEGYTPSPTSGFIMYMPELYMKGIHLESFSAMLIEKSICVINLFDQPVPRSYVTPIECEDGHIIKTVGKPIYIPGKRPGWFKKAFLKPSAMGLSLNAVSITSNADAVMYKIEGEIMAIEVLNAKAEQAVLLA